MIEQHIYAKTELGLETLSKSKGLADSYIEGIVRRLFSPVDIFCLDDKSFPGLKCAVPLDDGGILVANGIKKSGSTPSYIHSYIVNSQSLLPLSASPSFFTASCSYAFSDSPVLPALSELKLPPPADFLAMLHRLGMAEAEYAALLAAVFSSKEQQRNVFIGVGKKTGMAEISLLLSRIYADLPPFLRRSIGYMTLFGEVVLRPEINIYIVPSEKLSLSREEGFLDNISISRDYIFDIENKKYLHINDLKEDVAGDYVTFIRARLSSALSTESFFDFTEAAGAHLSPERQISLRFYDDLAYIYTLRENEEGLSGRLGRVTVIFTELLKSGAAEITAPYYSEFIRLYRRFIKANSALIPLEILRRLILNYDMCPEKQQSELYDLLSLDIELCMKISDDEALFNHIDAMRSSSVLYEKIIETKMLPGKGLIKRYFSYLFDKKRTVHALMEFADSVYADMPQMQTNEIFNTMLKERAVSLYNTSGDRLAAVSYLDKKSSELKEKYPLALPAASEIYMYALECFMTSYTVADATYAELEFFPLSGADTLTPEIALKHTVLLAAKEILALTDDLALSFLNYDSFGFDFISSKLSDDAAIAKKAEDELKEILRHAICEKKDAPKRILFTIAYYAESTKRPTHKVSFDNIYSFIDRHLPPGSATEFTEWYLSCELFMTPIYANGRIKREVSPKKPDLSELSAFYDATVRYFSGHGKALATDRNTKKLKKATDAVAALHPDYRALTLKFRKAIKLIVRENYTPAKRIADKIVSAKNFKFAMIVLVLAAVIASGIGIGSYISRRVMSGVAETKSYADSQVLTLDRTNWSAYKLKKDGSYLPAAECINISSNAALLDPERDEKIVVSFGTDSALRLDGISVSAVLSEETSGFNVYVTDKNNRKLYVGVSDYDIASGSSVYSFSAPLDVKNIILSPKPGSQGTVTVKEVNAYIIK